MDPVTWAKSKGLAYVGLEAGAMICIVLLLALTVLKITNVSYEPGINTSLVAVAAIFLAIMGMKFDKPDNDGTSA
ncbi:hypothetical protein [Natrinema soli]|uniref:Uncharacterized protein n=1 Tax=Natrinema soli TaxID=1930624 RepID=A0ABD5SNN7_9EURY|nr:hypothetical protein [Natrinema soli]